MPRITVAGGPSNAQALPGEVGYIGPAPVEGFATGGVVEGPGAYVVEGGPAPFVLPNAPVAELRGEHGPELVVMPQGNTVLPAGWAAALAPDAPDYASMTLAALRTLAKDRGLPATGSKAELAGRLAAHDAPQDGAP